MDRKKRNVSIRLSESDIRKTKEVSNRLGVKDSELFRFAIKSTLRKLTPLNDAELQGADLIPAWLVWGEELLEYFDLNSEQLNEIFNNDAPHGKTIDAADIDLMLLSRLSGSYVVKRLSEICGTQVEPSQANQVMKNYLYDKYVLGKECVCHEQASLSESDRLIHEEGNNNSVALVSYL